jgi:hypothetical protein
MKMIIMLINVDVDKDGDDDDNEEDDINNSLTLYLGNRPTRRARILWEGQRHTKCLSGRSRIACRNSTGSTAASTESTASGNPRQGTGTIVEQADNCG